jgi:hypothetical protein
MTHLTESLTMTTQALQQLGPDRPFAVPDHIGEVHVVVMNHGDNVPMAVSAMMNAAATRFGLRTIGGCSNMSDADREYMLDWFGRNLWEFSGFMSSGGTREVGDDGRLSPMVTEVPALIAQNGKVVTISTVPRVGDMQLVDNSRLRIFRRDEYGEHVVSFNPGVHMLVVVQNRLGDALDWDGDLQAYIKLFNMQRQFGWQFGGIMWNGGGVTKTELKLLARSGMPAIMVEGSGRAADEFIAAMRAGRLDLTLPGDESPVLYDRARHPVYVVNKHEPYGLRDQLRALGFPA